MRRARWLVLVVIAGVALGYAYCGGEEQPVAPPAPAPAPEPQQVPAPEPTVANVEADASEPVPPDAGHAPDASVAAREPSAKQIDDYMRKWREALAPLLSRKPPALAIEARGEEAAADAGCEPGVVTLPLAVRHDVDVLVVIDTSGSMRTALLRAIPDWLGQLEFTLARGGDAYRMLVLAEPRFVQLTDAGVVNRRIGSHDALDVLLNTAWRDRLRPNSEVHIAIITDDQPQATDAAPYLEQLKLAFADHRYSVSVIGGFETRTLLAAEDPPSTLICRGGNLRGIDPGLVYQQVAMQTGGYRASLCSEPSRLALVDALVARPLPVNTCFWRLQEHARLRDAKAYGPRSSDYLVPEYSAAQCTGTRRSYLLHGLNFALCPDTCEALKHDGFDRVEARIECSP